MEAEHLAVVGRETRNGLIDWTPRDRAMSALWNDGT